MGVGVLLWKCGGGGGWWVLALHLTVYSFISMVLFAEPQ